MPLPVLWGRGRPARAGAGRPRSGGRPAAGPQTKPGGVGAGRTPMARARAERTPVARARAALAACLQRRVVWLASRGGPCRPGELGVALRAGAVWADRKGRIGPRSSGCSMAASGAIIMTAGQPV